MDYSDVEIRGRENIKDFAKIVLFGAGSYLLEVLESFKDYNIVAVFDNHADEKKITLPCELPILNPVSSFHEYVDEHTAVVMSTCAYQYEIATDLVQNYQIKPEQIFSMCADYQEERLYNVPLINHHFQELKDVKKILSDDASRQYLDNLIRFKLTHNPLWLRPNPCIVGKYMYREKNGNTIMVKSGDTIIDGGAFIGDSAEYFMSLTNGDCKIFCFEPFIGNYEILQKMIQKKRLEKNIKALHAALGDQDQLVDISAGIRISARANINANEKNTNQIYQRKLDSMADEFDHINFIKLDIEGDERIALLGAGHLIQKYKPQMMISAYHKCEDLWELPLLIHELNPQYRIYLGHQPHAEFEPEIYVG